MGAMAIKDLFSLVTFYEVEILCLVFGVVCGFLSFVRKCKHLLNSLLRLEFVMVRIYLIIVAVLKYNGLDLYFVLFFLSLVACEGGLGLSLLVAIVRRYGRDKFRSFNVLRC